MLRNAIGYFEIVCILFTVSLATRTVAADTDIEKIQRDLVGAWIVDVAGEKRTRTLNIRGVEKQQDGIWVLDATYGWTDGAHGVVKAELMAQPNGYRLKFATQASSLIVAERAGVDLFTGTFTLRSGKLTSVKLERTSDEALKQRATDMAGSRKRSAITPPSSDVPPSCAAFSGAWTGRWPKFGSTWLWVVEIDANCRAKYAHRGTDAVPSTFRTAEIKQGVLAFSDDDGDANTFELHGDELWADVINRGGGNNAVFRKIKIEAR